MINDPIKRNSCFSNQSRVKLLKPFIDVFYVDDMFLNFMYSLDYYIVILAKNSLKYG